MARADSIIASLSSRKIGDASVILLNTFIKSSNARGVYAFSDLPFANESVEGEVLVDIICREKVKPSESLTRK